MVAVLAISGSLLVRAWVDVGHLARAGQGLGERDGSSRALGAKPVAETCRSAGLQREGLPGPAARAGCAETTQAPTGEDPRSPPPRCGDLIGGHVLTLGCSDQQATGWRCGCGQATGPRRAMKPRCSGAGSARLAAPAREPDGAAGGSGAGPGQGEAREDEELLGERQPRNVVYCRR